MGPNFFQTRMGAFFFEATMPQMVSALIRIAKQLEGKTEYEYAYTSLQLEKSEALALKAKSIDRSGQLLKEPDASPDWEFVSFHPDGCHGNVLWRRPKGKKDE